MSVYFERVKENGVVHDDRWVAKAGRVPAVVANINRSGPGCAFISFVGDNFLMSTVEVITLGSRLIADRMEEENFTLDYKPVEGLHEIRKALAKPEEEFILFMRGVWAGMKL